MLKKERNKLLRKFRNSKSSDDLDKYLDCKNKLKGLIKENKLKTYRNKVDSIENSVTDSQQFWKQIKSLTNNPESLPSISTQSWYNHFNTLFNDIVPDDYTDTSENIDVSNLSYNEAEDILFNSEITSDEVNEAVKELNINKSSSGSLVPNHLVYSIDLIMPYILKIFNRIFKSGVFPDAWTRFVIVPVYKKGSRNNPDNYRGIALLEIMSKLYVSILNKRLTFYVNAFEKLSESQAGFRAGYSTIDNAFILQSIISKYLCQKGRKLYVCFVDFKKAFDSVHRNKLFEILSKNGIKGNLFKAIRSIYENVKACVRNKNDLSEVFECPIGLRQGCNLSPVLFTLFINELEGAMANSGCYGIQLHPDLIRVFLLMFADDVALLADSVNDLQKQLNTLHSYCEQFKIQVNIDKTKIMIFKKGGRLAKKEKWYFNNSLFEVVNSFTYVGVNFTSTMSLYKMAEAMSYKAKRILVSLLSSLYNYLPLSYQSYFKIFDTKISSVLLYGAELWGVENMQCVESIHIYACKRYASAPLKTSNVAIMGDCGRFPLYISASKKCIKYWLRILHLKDDRYVRKCYNMLKLLDANGKVNWVSTIRQLLFKNGFGYIWENQSVNNETAFLKEFVLRLRDQYLQTWNDICQRSSKLTSYISFKSTFGKEKYLSVLNIKKYRYAFVSLRCSSHQLMIEKGRYTGLDRDQRFCHLCKFEIEDEYHFVLICPLYKELREQLIPDKYFEHPCRHRFNMLMSTENETVLKNLAAYIYRSYLLRKEFMTSL